MEGRISVETRFARVDVELRRDSLPHEECQRIVDGRFREGRDLRSQGSVNLVSRRMGTVRGKIVHYRYPLKRGADTVLEVAGGAFRERFASRGLKLQFSLPDSITVFGDRDRLMQLFNNLLENSLRYTDSGGSLQISAGQRDKTVRLTFADSAPGVSDDQLQKLFERFYRTEGSRNRASGGSGLGLAICLNIVEAHNGRIIAAHSPFGGVSITVELPLERDLQREV